MMKAEADFFSSKHHPIGIWIDFYQTRLTDRVIKAFVEMIEGMRSKVSKLGIVGGSTWARWKIN